VSGLLGQTDAPSFFGAGARLTGFLFDENLPRRLTFTPSLPVTLSVTLGKSISDRMLWNHCRAKSLVVVTKDADFSDRIMQETPPPWIVHLRFGNLRGKDYHALLAKVWPSIEALLPAHKLICVYRDRIESFRDS
jgi:predicted nuclease of predicted toxin-antitoxin system